MCRVCDHPQGAFVTQQILLGKMTIDEGARLLNVSYQLMWKHLREHLEEPKIDVREPIEILKRLIEVLEERIDTLCLMKVSPGYESALARHINCIRELIRLICELEGKLKKAPLVQLQVEFKQLTSFFATQLCPMCRRKYIEWAEALERT